MRDHSFSMYAKISEICAYMCVSGGKDVSFSGNIAYVLNG